jgi:hypothetical protein
MSTSITLHEEIVWEPLDPRTAADALKRYGNGGGSEPSLSVLLAMLCYSGPAEGITSNWNDDKENSLIVWQKRFFTLPRVQRILRAVRDGEAGDEVRGVLQEHLNRKGFYTAGTIGFWLGLTGWLKTRILNCIDPFAWQAFKRENDLPELAFIYSEIDLQEILKLPLRNLHSEESVENS